MSSIPNELVPLSTVCPCWTTKKIPLAVEEIKRGIEFERSRFRGKPFVVVLTRLEFDDDGLFDSVELLEGFPSEGEAVEYAKRSVAAAREAVVAKPNYANYQWQIVEGLWYPGFCNRPDRGSVRCLVRERFKANNGSGYESEYVEFAVLHVSGEDIVGPELIAYLGMEDEVTWYFGEVGKRQALGLSPEVK